MKTSENRFWTSFGTAYKKSGIQFEGKKILCVSIVESYHLQINTPDQLKKKHYKRIFSYV
jgi:hypothetical protein